MDVLTILCADGWMPANLSEGWRRMGWTVHEFLYGTHMGKSWTTAGLEENRRVNRLLLETAQQLKSEGKLDLIFAVIYDDVLGVETARALRRLSVPMVNYHVDMSGQWYRILRTGPYFDMIACAHRFHWGALQKRGMTLTYMPMAANPPQVASEAIPYEGVLYLGSPWLYRQDVLAKLADAGLPLRIFGSNWIEKPAPASHTNPWRKNVHDLRWYGGAWVSESSWDELRDTIQRRLKPALNGHKPTLPAHCIRGRYDQNQFGGLVRGAAINLGFTHFAGIPGSTGEKRQLRLRDYEIPMNGGFYLTQRCSQLTEQFREDEHVGAWNDSGELIEKVRFYLQNPAKRLQMADAAAQHAREHHTWQRRFEGLLRELKMGEQVSR